jgi:alpha-galactosidase
LHSHVRACVLPSRPAGPRRVHFNTWEAVGFDLDEQTLMRLADQAADLGCERFVLDDGWFAGRTSDRAGLGDWTPDPVRFPRGLGPLIDHVRGLGLDFGLWVEPEMVSPDSDLFREHPDWTLRGRHGERPTMRNQLVLDLAQPAVADHLYTVMKKLLAGNAVGYLKWDLNRDLFPDLGGLKPSGHARVLALHALIDRLRADFPAVEIETCSSGGARLDAAMLARTHRVWPSDQTDPGERLRIMRWQSLVAPLETLGAHVGSGAGRPVPMDFAAKVAAFGWMGIEADSGRISEADRDTVRVLVAWHKANRAVFDGGTLYRLGNDDPTGLMVVAPDQSRAVALLARIGFPGQAVSAPVRLAGLDPAARYALTLPLPWPRAHRRLADPGAVRGGWTASGLDLMTRGVALPLIDPYTAWLIELTRLG